MADVPSPVFTNNGKSQNYANNRQLSPTETYERSDGYNVEFRPDESDLSIISSENSEGAQKIISQLSSDQRQIEEWEDSPEEIPEEIIHGMPEEQIEQIYYKYESEQTPEQEEGIPDELFYTKSFEPEENYEKRKRAKS